MHNHRHHFAYRLCRLGLLSALLLLGVGSHAYAAPLDTTGKRIKISKKRGEADSKSRKEKRGRKPVKKTRKAVNHRGKNKDRGDQEKHERSKSSHEQQKQKRDRADHRDKRFSKGKSREDQKSKERRSDKDQRGHAHETGPDHSKRTGELDDSSVKRKIDLKPKKGSGQKRSDRKSGAWRNHSDKLKNHEGRETHKNRKRHKKSR